MKPSLLEETERLEVLRSYAVLDTSPETALDDLTRLAAHICGTPMALISLVDEERQWFKSRIGVEMTETPLDVSFCVHAVHQMELLVVPDATLDERFAKNPLVTGGPHIRFYAGAPLVTPEGAVLGTLCVADRVVRTLRPDQTLALEVLGRQVMTHLELHRQRRESQATTAKLQAIFDTVPDCVKLLQGDCTLLEMNQAGVRILDADSVEEVVGSNILPLIVPKDREMVREAVAEAAKGGQRSLLHFEILTAKGTKRWLEMDSVPFSESISGERLVLSVSRDGTKRKQVEEELLRSEASLANAQRIMKMGNWNLDLSTGQLLWSDQVHEMFGVPKTEFGATYEAFIERVHPDDREKMTAAHRVAVEGGDWLNLEHRIVLPNGTEKIVHERGDLLRDEAGKPTHLNGTVQDITERKLLEQHMLRAQRMDSIGTLAGGIAHDLNNALAPIMMSLEMLKMKFTDPASRDLLTLVATSAQRGADMVRQVLSFARGVEGRRVELPVGELLREVEKIARDTFPKNIRVSTTMAPDLWPVTGDATQLHQVLINLCVNARDAMPQGGSVKITAQNLEIDSHFIGMHHEAKAGRYVLLQITDNGSGMPASVLEKMFDPFFTTKALGKGTGLGLASVQAIVRSHGGFIRPYSVVGKGTKFNIYLPVSGGVTETVVADGIPLPRGHEETILVVDDEEAVREVTRRTLEAFGYRVLVAKDGVEALAIYAGHRVEIVAMLTDMMMPNMDGPELIRIVRQMSPSLPILAASGLMADEVLARLGVRHFLPKPYTAEVLLRILAEILPHTSH